MAIALWIVQGLVAAGLLMAGFMKATRPKEALQEQMAWVEDFSATQVKGIGVLEILGALGLILPMLTGILPILTPLAAVGLTVIMVGAVFTHIRRGETAPPELMPATVFLVLSAFIAYGRFVLVPVV